MKKQREFALKALIIIFALEILASCSGVYARPGWESAPPPPIRGKAPAHLGIPPGHLPPRGECRIWFPSEPPGQQPPPGNCAALSGRVPPGAWLLYRPYKEEVKVSVYRDRPLAVVEIRYYNAFTGALLRVEVP